MDAEEAAGGAGGAGGEEEGAPTAVFFKRRVARGNLRKRAADDDDEAGAGAGGGGGGAPGGDASAVVRPTKPRREGALGGSTAPPRDGDAAKAPQPSAFVYEADRQRQAGGDGGATATLQTETPFDRDARAAREAVLAQAGAIGADGREADDGLYHGTNAYIDYRKGFRREHNVGAEKSSGSHGPLRAPTNVRFTFIMDYKPDICKDYKQTGYCGYGDSCKFMHDRGDYKAGWQLDKEWEEKEKARKAREAAAVAGMLAEAEGGTGAAAEEEVEDDLPFACFICRRVWAEVRDPVVTRCKHYFCEQCALQHHAKAKTCATCNVRACVRACVHVWAPAGRPSRVLVACVRCAAPQMLILTRSCRRSFDACARSKQRGACLTRRTRLFAACATPRTAPQRSALPHGARRAPRRRRTSWRAAARQAGCWVEETVLVRTFATHKDGLALCLTRVTASNQASDALVSLICTLVSDARCSARRACTRCT
jgi:RING finger protein 113A